MEFWCSKFRATLLRLLLSVLVQFPNTTNQIAGLHQLKRKLFSHSLRTNYYGGKLNLHKWLYRSLYSFLYSLTLPMGITSIHQCLIPIILCIPNKKLSDMIDCPTSAYRMRNINYLSSWRPNKWKYETKTVPQRKTGNTVLHIVLLLPVYFVWKQRN